MWEPPPLPRNPRREMPRQIQSTAAQEAIHDHDDCYATIYRRFNCTPPNPQLPQELPEKLLYRYNDHYHATFDKMYLPEYEKMVNFYNLVLDALV
jgi:hypothetical protein